MLDSVLDVLADLPPPLLHLAVAGLAFAETAMFLDLLVPGEVGMVLAGAAAARAELPPVWLIVAGVIGATAGDSCSFALGRAVSTERLRRPAWVLDRARKAGAKAEPFFARHGGAAVFFGRFVGALRAAVPFAAGAGSMRYRRFLVWNVLASVAWVSTVVLLGWFLGEHIAEVVDRVGGIISFVAIAVIVVVLVVRRRRRHAGATAAA